MGRFSRTAQRPVGTVQGRRAGQRSAFLDVVAVRGMILWRLVRCAVNNNNRSAPSGEGVPEWIHKVSGRQVAVYDVSALFSTDTQRCWSGDGRMNNCSLKKEAMLVVLDVQFTHQSMTSS